MDQTSPTGQILNLLQLAHDSGASDLHLIPDSVPCLRIHGRLVAANHLGPEPVRRRPRVIKRVPP